jgi:hypothetical protein
MKLSTLLTATAVLALGYGAVLLVAPGAFLGLYGMSMDPAGVFMSRMLGAELIMMGTLAWLARAVTDPLARTAIVRSELVGHLIGFGVSLTGPLTGLSNALGWSTVAIYFALTVGYGYFMMAKPAA